MSVEGPKVHATWTSGKEMKNNATHQPTTQPINRHNNTIKMDKILPSGVRKQFLSNYKMIFAHLGAGFCPVFYLKLQSSSKQNSKMFWNPILHFCDQISWLCDEQGFPLCDKPIHHNLIQKQHHHIVFSRALTLAWELKLRDAKCKLSFAPCKAQLVVTCWMGQTGCLFIFSWCPVASLNSSWLCTLFQGKTIPKNSTHTHTCTHSQSACLA